MDIVNYIPHMPVLSRLISSGVQCAGGFPLWLVGGADHFNDIDLYTNTIEQWTYARSQVARICYFSHFTRHTAEYSNPGSFSFQVVQPGWKKFSDDDLLNMADLSPSACLLTHSENGMEWRVRAKYPEDIKNRICRVLVEHEFTPYRIESYRKRGYTIV